nr:MAG TPA: hypothetical protein [Caudoviricetes sp.]
MILFPSIIRFCIFKRSKKRKNHTSSHSSFIIVLTLITFIFLRVI